MSNKDGPFIPNRIDRDPSVILGVTGPEVFAIAWLSIPAFIFFAVITGIVFSSVPGGLFAGVVGVGITLFGGVLLLAKIKRNKPPNYILHKKQIILSELGISPAPFLYKSEYFRSTRDRDRD